MFMDNFWWMSGFLSDSRFRLLAVSNSSLRFSDFPLTTMDDFFFLHVISSRSKNMMDCIYHQWWNCWDFLCEKRGKAIWMKRNLPHRTFRKNHERSELILARKSKQPGVPTSFSQEKKILQFDDFFYFLTISKFWDLREN